MNCPTKPMPSIRFVRLLKTLAILAFALTQVVGVNDSTIAQEANSNDESSTRHFEMHYGGSVKGLKAGLNVRVWLPVPQTTDHQSVKLVKSNLHKDARETTESAYGNRMMYFEYQVGQDQADLEEGVPFSMTWQIQRSEVNALSGDADVELTDEERKRFMSANRLVPIAGKAQELLQGVTLPEDQLSAARELYNRVEGHMAYDKSKPGYGNGDVLWACDSKTGNCTDFHSLFISFARSRNIPAHFEIGFPLPPERGDGKIGGYHCWAHFFVQGKGWVPVDISEADKHPEMKDYYFGNLTENRVTFTKGRDIDLQPKQAGEPLNYFVYPYIEVDGEVWSKENIDLDFRFKDIELK